MSPDAQFCTPVSQNLSGQVFGPRPWVVSPCDVAPALAVAVALNGMAIWWFYGERPTRMEPQLHQRLRVLPAPLQRPSPMTVQEPGQVEVTAAGAVEPPLQQGQACSSGGQNMA